jgi:hypothetical protein
MEPQVTLAMTPAIALARSGINPLTVTLPLSGGFTISMYFLSSATHEPSAAKREQAPISSDQE